MLKKLKKDSVKENFDFNLIYPTTHDAVQHILRPNYLNENKFVEKSFFYKEKDFIFQNQNSSLSTYKNEDDYYSQMDLDESLMSVDEMDEFTSI